MQKRVERVPLRRVQPNRLFTEQQLMRRFQDIHVACERFVDAVNVNAPVKVTFDASILYVAVVSTYHDITRYKLYHLDDPINERSDAVKRAAYFTKWIVRLRPISAQRDRLGPGNNFHDDDAVVLINEAFGIAWALANLSADLPVGSLHLAPEKWGDLLYELVFRDMPADALLSMYQMYVELAQGRSPLLR